jgi:predicted nucleotidyltransferase
MDTFINDFKKTTYYEQLISDEKIVGIFIVGSRCMGTASANSDYDLQILTTADKYVDVSDEKFLHYKGSKVH